MGAAPPVKGEGFMDQFDQFNFEREDWAGDACTSQFGVYDSEITSLVEDVVNKLPERDWANLRFKMVKFFFHMDGIVLTKKGTVDWFNAEDADYIILLVKRRRSETLAAIAHELAHIVLGHPALQSVSYEEHEKNEHDAMKLAKSWGFPRDGKNPRKAERG